jgi:hypothetical protein
MSRLRYAKSSRILEAQKVLEEKAFELVKSSAQNLNMGVMGTGMAITIAMKVTASMATATIQHATAMPMGTHSPSAHQNVAMSVVLQSGLQSCCLHLHQFMESRRTFVRSIVVLQFLARKNLVTCV